MPPKPLNVSKTPVRLIHHAANNGAHSFPPGSLRALERCLAGGAALVEIDLIPLADGSFALLHDRDLSVETSGAGDAVRATREEIQSLTYKMGNRITDETVGFLEGAVEILAQFPQAERLQLDLKPYTPLPPAVLNDFINTLAPVADRVQVTSVADWALRSLRSLRQAAPDLALGFDPLLYLDLVEDTPRPEGVPPFRVGAYGLRDDHPLSAYQWGTLGEYFAVRAAALLIQPPSGCEWFIRAELLDMARRSGFDWIEFLHQHGAKVDAWTIDATQPQQVALARDLIAQGVDKLTTDAPAHLAQQLATETVF